MITPKHALRDHEKFAVHVSLHGAHPHSTPEDQNVPFGLFTVNGGSVTAGQPNFSHIIYPVNDHPADKASYDISFDVPAGTTAVANGDLVFRRTSRGRTLQRVLHARADGVRADPARGRRLRRDPRGRACAA